MYTTTSIDNTGVPTSLLNVFQVNGGTSSGNFFTFHGLDKSSQLFSGRLNVDGELVVLVDLELNRVPDLHRITVPALITVGRHDEITPACALRMKQHLPDAEVAVFANASHMPFYEQPEDYREALMGFLERRG